MMKTAVLTQETGSTAGVKAEPSSPTPPSLTTFLSSGDTPLPLPRTPFSPGPPWTGPRTFPSTSPSLPASLADLFPSPSAPPVDPHPSPIPVHQDSFALLPTPLSHSSPTSAHLPNSELLPSQMDTVAKDVPESTSPENTSSVLLTPQASYLPHPSGSALVAPPPTRDSAGSAPLPLTPVPPSVSSATPHTDILNVSAPPLPLAMSSPVPEVLSSESTLPVASCPSIPKPSSTPLPALPGAPDLKPSSSPVSSPCVLPLEKSSLSTPNIPPVPKPSASVSLTPPSSKPPMPTPLIPPVPKAPPLSPRVPPVSKLISKPSAPRKPSGPPQSRPPVPHPHSVAKPSSPALPRPPPPFARHSSPPLPPPLVPLAPMPSPAPSPALSPSLSPPLSPSLSPALSPIPTLLPISPASISILERLIKTCPVWLQLSMAQQKALLILTKESPGIFLVRKSTDQKAMVLSVRLSNQQGEPLVRDILVKEERSLMYLEGSVLVFDNIFKLIAFYCISRDILPFTLRLPEVIVQATKYEDMEMMSLLGSDFWGSQLNSSSEAVDRAPTRSASSWEIQQSVGTTGDRLWYVNPIFIEEYFSSLEESGASPAPILRSQSLNTPGQMPPKFKRPPPRPPNVPEVLLLSQGAKLGPKGVSDPPSARSPPPGATNAPRQKGEGNASECKGEGAASQKDAAVTLADSPAAKQTPQPPSACGVTAGQRPPGPRAPPHKTPPVPLRRKPSGERPSAPQIELLPHQEEGAATSKRMEKEEGEAIAPLACVDDASGAAVEENAPGVEATVVLRESQWTPGTSETSDIGRVANVAKAPLMKKAAAPVPPPRRKKSTPVAIGGGLLSKSAPLTESSVPLPQTHVAPHRPAPFPAGEWKDTRGTDVSLYSPEGGAALPTLDHDSYSTSSAEEEADTVASGAGDFGGTGNSKVSVKRTSTIMLDRAKHRLSMVNFSNVFTNLMSADHKLQKRIVELSRDGSSYFGNLLKDYRVYTLETMGKHSSSTELLQEIRQMMTQLKSYLIQSTELQNLLEPNVYTEDKLEVIIEAALCKAVLKPLREAVYSGLKDIHAKDGCLKRLKDNQSVVLGTTTTDLGVTTSIPETPVMEKIQLKLTTLHQEYSPQKKINLLLKTCKIIYDSMSVGCPGRPHGADDFLPVLMYVLARSNMVSLLLDVEYMMELMDPALQLGEGSYYLTTTYGVLEHIKHYDKQTVSRQLSLEIQDSIHRWERRRTLNKGRVSRSSVQDFINVSFLEAGCNTKTMGVRPTTTAQDLCAQCADKFEVLEPESYRLSVLVDGHYQLVAPEEIPLTIKSSLHHSEPRKDYYFVYRPGRSDSEVPEAEDLQPTDAEEPEPEVEESLIEI